MVEGEREHGPGCGAGEQEAEDARLIAAEVDAKVLVWLVRAGLLVMGDGDDGEEDGGVDGSSSNGVAVEEEHLVAEVGDALPGRGCRSTRRRLKIKIKSSCCWEMKMDLVHGGGQAGDALRLQAHHLHYFRPLIPTIVPNWTCSAAMQE